MANEYCGLLYDSGNFKSIVSTIDTDKSFYLKNQHDKTEYAYLSWRMQSDSHAEKFKEMGEGYFVSAIIILENCLAENRDRKGDSVIFPVLFNVEHAIELYLKASLKMLNEHGHPIQYRSHAHSISDLSESLRNGVQQISSISDLLLKDYDVLEAFIRFFYEHSNDVTFARYPLDTSDREFFYANTHENYIVDMSTLLLWVKALFYVLDRNFICALGYLKAQENQNDD